MRGKTGGRRLRARPGARLVRRPDGAALILSMSICAPWNDRLAEPLPQEHLVQLYRDVEALVDAVALYAGRGLGKGESVVLVATAPHLEAVAARLRADGFDLDDLEAWGQLTTIDAAGLLSRFLVDGTVDEVRFRSTLAELVKTARAGGRFRRIRVYGEMVNLLWRENHPATRQLEELWNDVIARYRIARLCGYRVGPGEAEDAFPGDLRGLHSHLIPVEAAF